MAAEQVIEQVAEHIEDVAQTTRHIDPRLVSYFLGGVGVGAMIGFFVGYRYNREKIKAEAFRESEAEIESIREHYQSKAVAMENDLEKKEMSEVIHEERYAGEVVEEAPISPASLRVTQSLEDLQERPLPVPVPISPTQRVFRSEENSKDKNQGWNFATEMSQRTADRPHILFQDEFFHNEHEFAQVTYTYYVADDVLVDTDDSIISDRDEIVGRGFQNRFGHGTDDFNILYVRNPVLELDIEICRTPASYEEQVLGLQREPNDTPK